VRALHRTAAARLEDHVGQREAREVLSHVVADVGPDAEQHALALVVASAILVGFAEVTRDNRSVDRRDELTEATGMTQGRSRQPARPRRRDGEPRSARVLRLSDHVGRPRWPEPARRVGDIEQTMMDDQLTARSRTERPAARGTEPALRTEWGHSPLLQATATKMDIGVRRVRRAEEEALTLLREDAAVVAAREVA